MASTKKSKPTLRKTSKSAKPSPRTDVGDNAVEVLGEMRAELEKVVHGARADMIASRARGEQLINVVQAKKQQVARHFYDIGKALSELQRDKLYVALGKKSFAQLLVDHDLLSLSQAKKLIAIADAFDRKEALALGTEKAYALVRMAKATPEDDTPQQLAAGKLRVAGKAKKTASLTAAAVDKAAKAMQAKTGAGRKPSAEEKAGQAASRKLQASLRRAGAKGAAVEVKRLAGGWKLVITISSEHGALLDKVVRKAEPSASG